MRIRSLLLVLILCVELINAQIITTADTTVCGTYSTPLQALSANPSLMSVDDQHGVVLPIGFVFNFYGQAYTQLVISGNGYVTFDLSQTNTYSPWPINIAIPNPGSMPENAIMAPWHDINTGVSGYISYGETGISPNRVYTITWCSIAMFSCNSDLFTSQIVLHEGSDKIEMFIQEKPLCTTWNSGAAIQGLVDATSTNFDIVIDPPSGQPRNYPLQWTANNEAWEFLPNGVSAYTISQTTYVPINTGFNTWTDLLGNTLGIGSSLDTTFSTTTTFIATISGSCIANSESDTVTITVVNPEVELGPDISLACNADTTLFPQIINGTYPYSYLWNTISVDSFLFIDSSNVYSVTVTDSNGCQMTDDIIISVFPAPTVDLGVDTNIACNSSYLLIPNVLGGTPPYVYLWSNGSALSSQTLGEGDYDLIVSDLFACGDTSSISITYDPPPVIDLGSDYTIACNTITTLIPNIVGGTQPYSYAWNDGSVNSSLDVSEGNYSLTVSDFWNCSDWDDIVITEDIPGTVTLSGGGSICDDGTTVTMDFNFNGLLPWNLEFTNGLSNQTIQGITNSNYLLTTFNEGIYDVIVASDVNDCLANIVGTAQVIVHPLPVANITPSESFIYEGDAIDLEVGDYAMYQWYNAEGLDLDTLSTLIVSDSGAYYVWVTDINGCEDESNLAIVHTQPHTNLFIPNAFTPNSDDHNELFVIRGVNVTTFNIQIFNRWGELMFISESIDKSWDGTFDNKKVQEGTYYYNVKVLGDDNRMLELSGTVNIIY